MSITGSTRYGWGPFKRPWGEFERYPQLQRTVPASAGEGVSPADITHHADGRWSIRAPELQAPERVCATSEEAIEHLVEGYGHTPATAAAMVETLTTVGVPTSPERPRPRSASWRPMAAGDLPDLAFEWSSVAPDHKELTGRFRRQWGVVPHHQINASLRYRADGYWWLVHAHSMRRTLVNAIRCAPTLVQAQQHAEAHVAQAAAEATDLPTPDSDHQMTLREQIEHPGARPALGVDAQGTPVEWDPTHDLLIEHTQWVDERADPVRLDTMALAVARQLADRYGREAVVVVDAAASSSPRRDEELKASGMDIVVARDVPGQAWEVVSAAMASKARNHREGGRFLVVLNYGALRNVLEGAGHGFSAVQEEFEEIDPAERAILVATEPDAGGSVLRRRAMKLEALKGEMWQRFSALGDERNVTELFLPAFKDDFRFSQL